MNHFMRIFVLGLCCIPLFGFADCRLNTETNRTRCNDDVEGRWIRVMSNIPDAHYLLVDRHQTQSWQGQGQEFLFSELSGKDYTLIFYSDDPSKFMPPESQHVTFDCGSDEHVTIIAKYQVAGQLDIESCFPQYHVSIQPYCSLGSPQRDIIHNYKKTLFLPEGKYLVTFLPLIKGNETLMSKPVEVNISGNDIAEAHGEYCTCIKSGYFQPYHLSFSKYQKPTPPTNLDCHTWH